jgi:hypothetical protein
MTHIITTLILISSIILPYLFGRYFVYKYNPDNFIDVLMYWLTGIIPILIIAILVFFYIIIYIYIK